MDSDFIQDSRRDQSSSLQTQNSLVLPEMVDTWQDLGWQPTETQMRQFQHLYELILSGNRQLNLTRITEPVEFWEKHLWDSLRGVTRWLQSDLEKQQVIDIGTGGGFPGIAVAIAQPHLTVTLLDATRKKIVFLETLITQLGIENAVTLTGRAEDVGQQPQHRESYDIALVRAVGPASVCAEYALPLLKLGGVAVLYRGQWTAEEAAVWEPVVKNLGGVIEFIEEFTTPVSNSLRHCLYIQKVAPTSAEFPRAVGIPTQKPL